ncbi:MAG: fibronectin type III domain-containing protein, partial [Actinomycetota bacterium]
MKGSASTRGLFAGDDSLTAESADVPVGGRAGLNMEWESAPVFGLRAVTMLFGAGVGAPVEKKGLVLVFPWKLSLMVALIILTAFAGARLLPRLAMMFKRITAVRVSVTVAVLLLAMAVCAIALLARPPDSGAVVGPLGTYTENTGDIIEVCADAACTNHTVSFTRGNTVYVRITTNRVSTLTGGNLRLRNYYDNAVGPGVNWTQVSFTSPYVFTSQVTIPATATTYEKVVGNLTGTGGTVRFEESLYISPINQYIRFYSDAARTDESYTFRDGATIYITAYGRSGVTYSQGATGNRNRLYRFDSGASVYNFPAPAAGSVTNSTNWWYFPLTLPAGLIDGDWYWLRTYLRSTVPNDIERMSRMIQIDNSVPLAAITLPPNGSPVLGPAVSIEGTASDTYSFYRYIVEYGVGAAPATWTQIGATSYTPVVGGQLQVWDTTALADGLHTLRLTVTDRAYNTSSVTSQVIAANPPVISAVQASPVKGTSATVTWTTDEPSNSQVEYGTSPGVYTDATVLDPALVTSHSQVLSNLQPSTVYYYRVRSADAAGNVSYSTEYSFQTLNVTILQPFPSLGRDTYIGSGQPTWNRGADALMRAGDYPGVDWGTLRSTLYVDLSGIPASATIDSATLSLYQSWQGDTSTVNLNAHYLTRDWTEGTGSGAA